MTPHEYVADKFPPLTRYCPILEVLSAPQVVFLLDDRRETMYGGAVGGGKSAALLAAALRYVDMPGYSALLLRRTYPELEKSGGLIPLADQWFANTDARRSDSGKKWKFPSGARIEFGHVQHEHDKTQYQGAAYTMVGFDELTHFTESIYDYIGFSRQRRDMRVVAPIQTMSSANPGGVGHLWVKERFIKQTRPGMLFVPAKVADNPNWRPGEYEKSLAYLPDELRRQLLDGDWEAFEEQAFPRFGPLNIIDTFPMDDAHRRFECADYGFNGTAWYLVVTDYDGNLIFVDGITCTDLMPSEIAPRILAKRKQFWGIGNRVQMDPTVVHRRTGGANKFGEAATLGTEFEQSGVPIIPANNDPRAGYARLRELIEPREAQRFPNWHPRRGERNAPRLFIAQDKCPDLVEQIRSAPLQPIERADGGEKIDPHWEGDHGHSVAAARYGVMSWPAASVVLQGAPEDPRAALIWRHRKRSEEAVYEAADRYDF